MKIFKTIMHKYYNVVYFFYLKNKMKTSDESRELTFVLFRNILGISIISLLIFLFVSLSCFFDFNFKLSNYRLQAYTVLIGLSFVFLGIAKRKIKPILNNIEIIHFSKTQLKKNNLYYKLFMIIFPLSGVLLYVVCRLITINC